MLSKIQGAQKRFEELTLTLQDPAVLADAARTASLMKEYKKLEPIALLAGRYLSAHQEYDEAQHLLDESGLDADMKELAKEQLADSRAAMEALEGELKLALMPQDDADEKNVIVEIRAGAGGEEAALFANSLYRMYSMYADRVGWKCELLNLNATELGGIKEIIFSVDGDGVYHKLKFESGVHRVQRVPETETQGRIHTSTVTVAVMPEAEEVELTINPNDLRIDTFRSSGAGGQHINKTSSAIRITYLPTGMVVECQDERSQFENKDKAMKVLRSRLLQQKKTAAKNEEDALRRSQVGTGDRSERIRTYNFPQGRLTDHRIGLTLYGKLDNIMNGDLDEVLDALILAEQAKKLAGGSASAE